MGLVASFNGRDYNRGYNVLYGVKLALQQWNDHGGVEGYRIELVAQDDQNDPQVGLLQAQKMVLDPAVIGVVGHLSDGSALASLDTYRQASMPVLLTEATSDQLTSATYRGLVRLNPGDQRIALETSRFVKERLQASSVAIISGDDPAGLAQATAMAEASRQLGLKVTYEKSLARETAGYKELIAGLQKATPDVVICLADFVQDGDLLRQVRAAGLRQPFVAGPLAANPDFVKIAGLAAEGAYYLSLAPDPRDLSDGSQFAANYKAVSYGRDPWASAVLAYDATDALLRAVVSSLTDGQAPRRDRVVAALPAAAAGEGIEGKATGEGPVQDAGPYIYRLNGVAFPGDRQF